MAITKDKFEALMDDNLRKTEFKNKHGETFTIYVTDHSAYFTGSETDNEVLCLFNNQFNIFAKEELFEIGKALMELSK